MPLACWDVVRCPACNAPLLPAGGSAACDAGHRFDLAREGYLNLNAGRGHSRRAGDTSAMVAARARFLAAGHFAPVAAAVATAVAAAPDAARGRVAEIGCGTGYYLAAAGAAASCRYGVDLSKHAVRAAARLGPGALLVVADAETLLPFADAAFDVVLSVFAPRPAAEVARVLRPGGLLVVASATTRHFAGVRERLGLLDVRPAKPEAIGARFAGVATLEAATEVTYDVTLPPGDLADWLAMGPNARHDPARADIGGTARVTVSVDVLSLRREA